MEKNIWSLYFLHIPLVISSWYQVLSIVQMLISHLYLQVSSCLLNNKKLISICPFSLWTPRKYLNLVRLRFSSINSWLFLKVKVKIFRKANKLSVTLLVLLIMPRILSCLLCLGYYWCLQIILLQSWLLFLKHSECFPSECWHMCSPPGKHFFQIFINLPLPSP
jgi:hypothetical protein